jgi:hypothetical protein
MAVLFFKTGSMLVELILPQVFIYTESLLSPFILTVIVQMLSFILVIVYSRIESYNDRKIKEHKENESI